MSANGLPLSRLVFGGSDNTIRTVCGSREEGNSTMTIIRIQAKSAMLAAVAVCAFLVTGCGGHSPQSAADTYLSNLKLYNYPATYQALSHQDQVDRTMDQFLTEIPMAPDVSKDWFQRNLR